MLVSMTITMFLGNLWSLDGLTNTTIVYLILWICEKFQESYFHRTDNIWLFMFILSWILYFISYQLHMHPEFIVSMFK